jgi:hypothetical protein
MIKIERSYIGQVTPMVINENLVYETKNTVATVKIKIFGIVVYNTHDSDDYKINPPVISNKKDKVGF